jgi:cytochrome P450
MSTLDLPHLPFPRADVLDVAPLYRTLAARAPISQVRTPAGDVAWLVTGYAEMRELFADRRLGRSHPDPDRAARISGSALLGGPMGNSETEARDHALMRRLLAPAFSARRLETLRGKVIGLVDELLDGLEAHGSPADLHEMLSFPLPVLVICDLLGVPYADRDRFRSWSTGAAALNDRAGAASSMGQLVAYMRVLVASKRAEPAEDVISDLAAVIPPSEGPGGRDAADGIAGLAAALLFAGHETTVTRIDVGTLLLLAHPDQAEAIRRDPSLVPLAVEEILRLAAPGGGGLPRYAQADIDIAGVRIKEGDAVLLATSVANRDPGTFEDADRFEITRQDNPHLAFGHGSHYCVGAALARIELQAVFPALLQRFGSLRLEVPPEQLDWRNDLLTGGVARLPVAW